MHIDAAVAPLAGVFHDVAGDLQEVLFLALEIQVRRRAPLHRHRPAFEDLLQRAGQLVERGANRGAVAGALGPRGGAGAAQMMVDLHVHGLGLAMHHSGQLAPLRAGFGQQDRQGRLQGVGEVADVGPLPIDDFLVVRNERVQLLGQRRELSGIAAFDPFGPPLAHVGDLAPQIEQGLQAHPHLDDHRRHQPRSQEHEQGRGADGEQAHVPVDRGAVLGDHEHHRRRPAGKLAGHGHGAQRLARRPGGLVDHRRAHGQASKVAWPG